jgi:hypothetical protein
MSIECHFVFLNRNIYLFIFILVENFFLTSMIFDFDFCPIKIQENKQHFYYVSMFY